AQRGATAALEELARRAGTVQRRTECAEIAARALLALRRHALAAELYSAASEGSSNAERLQRIADLLRKTHRREEHKLDTASAADVVRSALVLALEPQPAPARLDDLDAAVARKALRDEHTFQRVGARIAAMHRQMGLVDVPTAAAQDLLLAELDTTAEGDSNEGFRVTARAGAGAAAVSLTAFLAIEDGRPRVLCIDTCGLLIGEHVLSLAVAGRLSAAARFLTWQRPRFDPASREPELCAARGSGARRPPPHPPCPAQLPSTGCGPTSSRGSTDGPTSREKHRSGPPAIPTTRTRSAISPRRWRQWAISRARPAFGTSARRGATRVA